MSVKITVEGARVNFARWDFALMNSTWRNRIAPVVLEALRNEAPVYKYPDTGLSRGQRPGDLKKSLKMDTIGLGATNVSMTFISDVAYAKYVIEGTPDHDIKPGTGTILHWQRAGTHYYRRWVHHPGTAPNNFPDRAIQAVQPEIRTTLQATVEEYIQPEQT